jgi:hypothetical protein
LRTMASRRFDSSRPTASNSNAATRITINTYRLANMGQWLASNKERSLSGSAVLRKPCANLIDPYSVAVLRHSMDEKWRVSRVELLEGGLLYGFVLYDQRGRPSASFGYSDRAKAKLGRNHVAAALKDAEQVLGP